MALELLSQFCTFENSTECSKILFDSDSRQNDRAETAHACEKARNFEPS